ncbi:uncharacterized protein [Hemitrygon akajei]|uniref:uncharacterized protein isoform X1 n=1 Tax=Hemitrygon akajei TaxID=2704970 RepID=UPI003BF973A8
MEREVERLQQLREKRDYEEYRLYCRDRQTRREQESSRQQEWSELRGSWRKVGDESLEEIRERTEKQILEMEEGTRVEKEQGRRYTPGRYEWQPVVLGPAIDKEPSEEGSLITWNGEKEMLPLLVKGSGQVQYIPWGSQDLEGLKNTLPSLHEGAGKWIRAFEEETMGRLLAMGDLKALLIRLMGTFKLKELMEMAGLQNVDSPQTDGANFDPVRQRVWQALRKLYPPRVDPKALKGELLGDTENPAAYVENQLKKWRLETEQEVENNLFLNSLFRQSILDAMPPQVKSKLEEVVGLSSLTPQAFSDHIVHAVEKYRRDKRKLAEQQEEVQRKLLQMQLEELKKKDKDKSKKMLPAITSTLIMRATAKQFPMLLEIVESDPRQGEKPMMYCYSLHDASSGLEGVNDVDTSL